MKKLLLKFMELLLKMVVVASLILALISGLALTTGDCDYETQFAIVFVITTVINFSVIGYNYYCVED